MCRQHISEFLDYKKCYSSLSQILLITGESENENNPVLVSAHPPPKSADKILFTETFINQYPGMIHSSQR